MINKIKYIILIIVIGLFFSCTNYKFLYFPSDEERIARKSKVLEHIIKKEELFLCFTKNYYDTGVKVTENDSVVFDGKMTTKPNGTAETFKVNIYAKTVIYFDGIKEPLLLDYEKKKLYKYVYLEKEKNKVIIEFNNGYKKLGSLPPNQ